MAPFQAPEGEVIDPLPSLEAVAQLVHGGCGCHAAYHFTAFQNVSILHFQEHLTSMLSREVDLCAIAGSVLDVT